MRLIKRFLFGILLAGILTYLLVAYLLSNRVLQTNSSFERTLKDIETYWGTTYEEMIALLPPPTDFDVKGVDEVIIRGKYFNVSDSASCVFIFAHGWARSWPNMLKYYPMVDECGCNIVMYDHRAHGSSGGNFPTGGIMEGKDLLSVTNWVAQNKKYQWDQIAWLGSSWGAATVLMAGAEDQNPAFIVADSPFQDWYSAIFERAIRDYGAGIRIIAPGVMQMVNWRAGIDYREANAFEKVRLIEEPVLLIHSAGDPETSSQQSVRIAQNLNDQSVFHHTDWGNIHVMDVINNTEELEDILLDFIQKNELNAFIPTSLTIDSLVTK